MPKALVDRSARASAAACELGLKKQREQRRTASSDTVRIATWNVKYFPDAEAGLHVGKTPTDVEWLACAIASLDVDLVTVQEFKAHSRARRATQELLAELGERTEQKWEAYLGECAPVEEGRAGFLYATPRVRAKFLRSPPGEQPECVSRTAQAAGYFAFANGFDAHVVAIHAPPHAKRAARASRERAFDDLPLLFREAQQLARDTDAIFAGDFNTIGCQDCTPPLNGRDEIAALARQLERTGSSLVLAPPEELQCSQYSFEGDAHLLDHFVVSKALSDIARVRVEGFCRQRACRTGTDLPVAHTQLSDHCPMVLTLTVRPP